MLRDCISRDRGETELLVVREGVGAKTAAGGRNRFNQAVLSISPSMLRVEGADLAEVLDDPDCQHVIACLGVGIQLDEYSSTDLFDVGRLRYGKVILALDGSKKGRDLRENVEAFLRLYFRPLLREGRVFSVELEGIGSADEFGRRVLDRESRQLTPLV